MAVTVLKKGTLALAGLLLVAQAQATELLNSSYDVSRELFAALNPPFEQQWAKDNGGDKLTIKQSHAGSSKQALAILKQIKQFCGEHELIFIGDHDPRKPMSENTVNSALRVMGYDTKVEVCGHGFRTMACSSLIESGLWSEDAVERQMSHMERNTVRAAYIHKAEHLDERKLMLQWWADFLDANREKTVSPFDYAKLNNPMK